MFDVGQAVLVITDKGVAYNGAIMARAKGDDGGPPAYQIAFHGREEQNQWHKSCEVFVPEETQPDEPDSIEKYLRK